MIDDPMTSSRPRRAQRHDRGGRSLVSLDLPHVRLGGARVPALAAAAAVAFVLLLAAADVAVSWGRVHPGVTVGGVAVGGMSASDARALLDRELTPRLKLPVTVTYQSRRWTVSPSRVSARLDAGAAADAAFAIGRDGGLGERIVSRLGAWFGRQELPLQAKASESRLTTLTAEMALAVDVPARDASIKVNGTDVTRTSAKDGLAADRARLRSDLLAAFVSQHRIVKLSVAHASVSVTDEDAQRAYDDARRMVSGDVVLTWQQRSWTVSAGKVGKWITFRAVPWSPDVTATLAAGVATPSAAASVVSTGSAPHRRMTLVAAVAANEVSATLTPLVKGVGKPAVDAKFVPDGDKIEIRPSQSGIGVDVSGLTGQLNAKLRVAGSDRTFALALTEHAPRISTKQAQAMGVKELISSFSTEYDPGNAPRVNNIHTLARSLDGKLVPPGGVFSFNGAVGERTAEKGYQEAPAIVNGKLVPQLGGGICQTATTFFNAVFFSGFPVIERTNHSQYISHYPKGRDCTVSWGGPDFRFKNDSKAWVLIHTSYDDSSITFSLYGTDPGYKVSYSTGPFTNIVPAGVERIPDPTLALGKTEVSSSGVDGKKVVVIRTVTLNGAVVRKDTFVSVYKPSAEQVRVGTMKPSAPASSTVTTPASGR